ncbi:MAG: alkaline phosphatase family protein, partial [Thermoproteota archaeon]
MKIIILGLDGATWAVLKPLSDTGFLPNIKRLIEHGCMGVLKSTIPPMTSPAWPCLATGVNPGKIGAFSTLMRIREEDFRLIPVNSSVYRGNSFWDMLSRKGYRVALVKIPFLYP